MVVARYSPDKPDRSAPLKSDQPITAGGVKSRPADGALTTPSASWTMATQSGRCVIIIMIMLVASGNTPTSRPPGTSSTLVAAKPSWRGITLRRPPCETRINNLTGGMEKGPGSFCDGLAALAG